MKKTLFSCPAEGERKGRTFATTYAVEVEVYGGTVNRDGTTITGAVVKIIYGVDGRKQSFNKTGLNGTNEAPAAALEFLKGYAAAIAKGKAVQNAKYTEGRITDMMRTALNSAWAANFSEQAAKVK